MNMSDSTFKTLMIILIIIVIVIMLFVPCRNEISHVDKKEHFKREHFIDDSIKREQMIFKGTMLKDYENPGTDAPTKEMLMTEMALEISPDHETPLNVDSVVMSTPKDNSVDSESNSDYAGPVTDITDVPTMSDEEMNKMIQERSLLKMYIEDPIGDNFKNTPIGTMNENPNNKDNKGMSEVELTTVINRYRNDMLDSIQGGDDRNRYVFKNFPMYGRVYY